MDKSGNYALIATLRQLGIHCFAGVNGGGVIHILKYLTPFNQENFSNNHISKMFTLSEYAAGFMPLGYYLASGRIAGCIATTGAAIKLTSSGLTDAKISNIPAVYIFALNPTFSTGKSPLQDVSVFGMNIIPQLQAELGEDCIVIEDMSKLAIQLNHAQKILNANRPVVFTFYPDILSKNVDINIQKPDRPKTYEYQDVQDFLAKFPAQALNRRVVIYVCSEAARCSDIKVLTTEFSKMLQAPTVWSVNGANAISADNPYGYGYITFGGNDKAKELWQSLDQQDVVITLGFDPGNMRLFADKSVGVVWHFTDLPHPYGSIEGSFRHRVAGEYFKVRGNIGDSLETIINSLKTQKTIVQTQPGAQLADFNFKKNTSRKVRSDCVNIIEFYLALNQLWQPHSIGFDDVCLAYKDRQYVTQRPNPNINFYSLQDGSAMGATLGLGIGAKLADPTLHTFIFTGDGCWRLFAGNLADARNLDLRLFVFNNQNYALVSQALKRIMRSGRAVLSL